MEKVNFSFADRKYSFADVKTEADERGSYVGGFISDCIDAFMLRKIQNPLFHQVVFERSHDAGDEWRIIERAAEEAIVNNLLERERTDAPLKPAEIALLKKHCVGLDYVTEKALSEVTAKKRILDLCNSKKITDAEYKQIDISMLASAMRTAGEMDEETFLEFVKNLSLNNRLMKRPVSITTVKNVRCDLDGSKLAETITTIGEAGMTRKTEIGCKKCGSKKTVK